MNANGNGLLSGITNNRLVVALLSIFLLGAVTWFTTVSDAREKVAAHAEEIPKHRERLEQLERNEIRRTEEFRYINRQLEDILRKLDERRNR